MAAGRLAEAAAAYGGALEAPGGDALRGAPPCPGRAGLELSIWASPAVSCCDLLCDAAFCSWPGVLLSNRSDAHLQCGDEAAAEADARACVVAIGRSVVRSFLCATVHILS